jgi:mannose-6-phosphate isomerase-like protein (cupin superfamily)
MSESFFVLSGQVRIYDGRRWLDCPPGHFVHVPPGGVHGFRNESGAPADLLILFAPGAPREGYFEELAEISSSGRQLDDVEWVELWARHDQYPA